ncbi:DeoR family transcriptional regulator [Arhodomonas sp. AD133]|uniref:DeoR family transcriptional regulator n=1 Tax=Arhodomonas sp. AD133 TaxID=3415009 RepID=UPI003EC0327B
MPVDDTPMELNPRQESMLAVVREQGFASVEALAQHFDVTAQTIRRDINSLCRVGLLRRYHGGAGLPSSVENVAYTARQVMCLAEKQRIAAAVAEEIPDQASLFITLGTTTEEVAKALMDHHGLRVITNNLNVATIMSGSPSFEVIIAGGVVRHRDRGVTGEPTIDFINQFRVDCAVIGISGIDQDGTLLDFDYREVRVQQAIIDNARSVFLVADHTKFGRNAMVRLGDLAQVHSLFTDEEPPPAIRRLMAESGGRVVVA